MTQARRPTRQLAALVAVAVATALIVVLVVALTRGAGAGDGIAEDRPAPAITGTALDGSPVDLASLRGHPVVINFWASWCGPCREEMPLLAQKAAAHAAEGLVVLGVLSDDTVANGLAFEQKYGATWKSVFDPTGEIKRAYRILAQPQSFFIDREGILRSINIGYLTDVTFDRKYALIAGGS